MTYFYSSGFLLLDRSEANSVNIRHILTIKSSENYNSTPQSFKYDFRFDAENKNHSTRQLNVFKIEICERNQRQPWIVGEISTWIYQFQFYREKMKQLKLNLNLHRTLDSSNVIHHNCTNNISLNFVAFLWIVSCFIFSIQTRGFF